MKSKCRTMGVLKSELRGSNLKKNISDLGISMWKVAKDCGMSYRTLQYWQKGATPGDEHAERVGEYLGLWKKETPNKTPTVQQQINEVKHRITKLEEKTDG